MKYQFWQTKRFVLLVGFLVGALSMWAFMRFVPLAVSKVSSVKKNNMQKFSMPMPDSEEWDPFFDDFFDSQIQEPQADPFDMLHRMREQMMRKTHPFDSWYQRRFGGGAPGEIKRLEDNDYIIYQISIKGLDKQSLNVEVKDQQIELKGRMEEKDENGNVIMQSFVRSFPVPRGVNSAKVEIESDQEKIILKFPKLKAE